MSQDLHIIRDLAARYAAVCAREGEAQKRVRWRRHNSLQGDRPLVLVRAFAWEEMPDNVTECEDAFWHPYEQFLRRQLFCATLGDDRIFEPWLPVRAAVGCPPGGVWGVGINVTWADKGHGRKYHSVLHGGPEDFDLLTVPRHEIDDGETARRVERVGAAVGDLLTVDVDRGPVLSGWNGDLSTCIGQLRGIEAAMIDMCDNQEYLHRLLAFMRDGVLHNQAEAEAAGDLSLTNHANQAMTYAEELADPAPNSHGVRREQLWGYMASQEMTLVGPDMWWEFMLQYQVPIMAPYGLTAYGCCEDLTRKIDYLRRVPNLRRIAVAPAADVAACAEQIGPDYVISYRPSPADMVSYGLSDDRVRALMRADLEACRGLHVDITLKDVHTVQGDPGRLARWVQSARQVVDELWG